MKKPRRLNVRLSDAQHHRIARRAQFEGMSAAEYVRSIVETDLNSESDAIIRRLARQILFVSVATRYLLKSFGQEDELQAVAAEVQRLADQLGLDDAG